MTDRGKAIKALECNLNFAEVAGKFDCEQCGYECRKTMFLSVPIDLLANALALLKAQEPRVMTLEEAADAEICWIEVRSRRGVEPGKVRIYREDDYSAFINRLLPYVNENMPQHEYGEHWRCWNVRPDEKRRAETPWRL